MSDFVNLASDAFASEGLSVLRGNDEKKEAGSFVYTSQGTASEQGFSHVSKLWYPKTLSYEQGLSQLAEDRAQTEDIMATVRDMVPTVDDNGAFAFLHRPSERYFRPTVHALCQVGLWAKTGTWVLENLSSPVVDNKGRVVSNRDRGDSETLAKLVSNGFRRMKQDKSFLWRTRQDGSLRALLTDRYAIVDNEWFVNVIRKVIPGGRLSHWKGNSDTIWGNVLIPDTIRVESDSDYGGMLSIGNSEIGERRVSSVPSIFRAICMNGCIWGRTIGKGIRQVHRGAIDLHRLEADIKHTLLAQVPLLPQGIDKLLALRTSDLTANIKAVVATIAKDNKLGKRQASNILSAHRVEVNLTPDNKQSFFSLVNAVTRAAQAQTNPADWVKFDELGGNIVEYTPTDVSRLVSRANTLTVEEVDEVFA